MSDAGCDAQLPDVYQLIQRQDCTDGQGLTSVERIDQGTEKPDDQKYRQPQNIPRRSPDLGIGTKHEQTIGPSLQSHLLRRGRQVHRQYI